MKLISLLFVLGAIVLLAFISSTHWRNHHWDMAVFGIGLILVLGSAVPSLAKPTKSERPILLDDDAYHRARSHFFETSLPGVAKVLPIFLGAAGFLLVGIALIVWGTIR